MPDVYSTVFGLLGGLAIFLFGMNSMSDSLQKAAGNRMKSILGFLTRNPLMGVLAGALVTAVLQSSSATTVMVIGFTSAGLMTLKQGISCIFGANIGTTITAQIIAFKLSDYIFPIIFIGFVIFFIFKKENIKNIGLGIFSFGILFLGIELMGDAMKPLASSDFFINLIAQVNSIPVLGLLLGTCMTLVVQSSSATIAVLQNFASQPMPDGSASLNLAQCLPILFGDNIGTTITALIACIGQSRDAKRCAIAHTVFNVTGSIVFMFLIPVYAPLIEAITPGETIDVISRQIANAHTVFNVTNCIVWTPLIGVMVKIVTTIVPGKSEDVSGIIRPHFINNTVVNQPVAAMHLLSQELQRLASIVYDMLEKTQGALTKSGRRTRMADIKEQGYEVEEIQKHILAFISAVLSSNATTEAQSETVAGFLVINNNISRVSERLIEIVEIASNEPSGKLELSEGGKVDIDELFQQLENIYKCATTALIERDKGLAEVVISDMSKVHKCIKKCNKNHLKRINAKECSATLENSYPKVIYACSRIADSCYSLAEEVLSEAELMTLELAQSETDEASGMADNAIEKPSMDPKDNEPITDKNCKEKAEKR